MGKKWSLYLYKKIFGARCWQKIMGKKDLQNMQNLILLNPGKEPDYLLAAYHADKLRIVGLLLLVGSLFSVCIKIAESQEDMIQRENILKRPEIGQEILLEVHTDDGEMYFKEDILLDISETLLTPQEADIAFEELVQILDNVIWERNESAEKIFEDLYLPETMEGYPFVLNWDSSDRKLLEQNGKVNNEELEQAEELTLTVETVYEDIERKHRWELNIQPQIRTKQQQFTYNLKRESERRLWEQRYDEEIMLPAEIAGQKIYWHVKKENKGNALMLVTLSAAVLIYGLKDRDLLTEVVKRREKMKREYPLIVSKYALYLQAGMTVRGAFEKISGEQTHTFSKSNPVYDEMNYACNELKAGVSESKVLDHFARRTGVQEYTRLCTLLTQNLKKGNTLLVQRLQEESAQALREGLQEQKRRGENAGTKLLVPMGLLLMLVLVMIVIPAFNNLG